MRQHAHPSPAWKKTGEKTRSGQWPERATIGELSQSASQELRQQPHTTLPCCNLSQGGPQSRSHAAAGTPVGLLNQGHHLNHSAGLWLAAAHPVSPSVHGQVSVKRHQLLLQLMLLSLLTPLKLLSLLNPLLLLTCRC